MVMETRRRVGRGTRTGTGHSTHQQVFCDHIRHSNKCGLFEKKKQNGHQEVKIKQEQIEENIGMTYMERDSTVENSKTVKDQKVTKEIIKIEDEVSKIGENDDSTETSRKEQTRSGILNTGKNKRNSPGNRVAKRSRNFHQDIREFIQKLTQKKTSGEHFTWKTINHGIINTTREETTAEGPSSLLKRAMGGIDIDKEDRKEGTTVRQNDDSLNENKSYEEAIEDEHHSEEMEVDIDSTELPTKVTTCQGRYNTKVVKNNSTEM